MEINNRSVAGFLLFASVTIAFGCAKPLPDKAPVPVSPIEFSSNEWRVTDQVVVVTDGSGTQWFNKTFPDAKALTRSFVSSMPDSSAPAANPNNYQAGLVGFGGNERQVAPLSSFNRSALQQQASQLQVMGAIDGTGGRTPLHDVLVETSKALQGRRGRTAVVIFSDGLPDDPALTMVAAKLMIENYPDPMCIHTVQTGDDPAGTATLQMLSQLTNCGSYQNGAQLASAASIQQFSHNVFAGTGVPAVAASPCDSVVRLQGVVFDFDKSSITPGSAAVLDVVADQLRECPNIRVTVGGHTDSIGSAGYNDGLSQRRANSTRDYLVGKGVGSNRLTPRGYGESSPVASNDTEAGRSQNRRVELTPGR